MWHPRSVMTALAMQSGQVGIPQSAVDEVLVTPFNDLEALEHLLASRHDELAGEERQFPFASFEFDVFLPMINRHNVSSTHRESWVFCRSDRRTVPAHRPAGPRLSGRPPVRQRAVGWRVVAILGPGGATICNSIALSHPSPRLLWSKDSHVGHHQPLPPTNWCTPHSRVRP